MIDKDLDKCIHLIQKIIKKFFRDIINGQKKEIKFMDGKNNDFIYIGFSF